MIRLTPFVCSIGGKISGNARTLRVLEVGTFSGGRGFLHVPS